MAENRRSTRNSPSAVRAGFTLVEVLVSTLIAGVVLVTAMNLVGGVFKARGINAQIVDAPALAQQLLSEVLAASYEDPDETPVFGHEAGETTNPTTRAEFDDVDDYDVWTANPPQLKDGTAIPGFTGWTRSIAVVKVDPSDPGTALPTSGANDRGLRVITVTVTDPDGEQTTVESHRSIVGATQQSLGVDTTLVTYLRAELQIGQDTPNVVVGIPLVNHAEDQ